MKVTLMQRRSLVSNFSVEQIVQDLVKNFGTGFQGRAVISRFHSRGVLRRVYNIIEAALRQGDINHVVGDVHFLTYLLDKEKTVLTVLDCGGIAGELTLRKQLLKMFWFTIPVRRCAAITVISEAVKQDLLRHERIDPGKIRVVPVAVPSQYTRIPRAFNAKRPVLLQIGGGANKNRERLFEAVAGIPCRLDIVGMLRDEHRALLQKHGIEYRNFVKLSNEEMLARYAECDIVAFPSTFEGFGMPIIEGNLVGRPVITGNVASMPEVARDAACLIDPFDVASIRAGILRVINDVVYRETLVENGFENAKRYDAKIVARLYEETYLHVAAQKR